MTPEIIFSAALSIAAVAAALAIASGIGGRRRSRAPLELVDDDSEPTLPGARRP